MAAPTPSAILGQMYATVMVCRRIATLRSTYEQYGFGRNSNNSFRNAAEEQTAKPASAMRPDHNEVSRPAHRLLLDRIANAWAKGFDYFHRCTGFDPALRTIAAHADSTFSPVTRSAF